MNCGGLDFGVVVDRDLVDDPWPLTAALRLAQAELVALATITIGKVCPRSRVQHAG
jgi:hypothetical protein